MGPLADPRPFRCRRQRLRVRLHARHPLLQLLAVCHAHVGRDDELQCARDRLCRGFQHRILLGVCEDDLQRAGCRDMKGRNREGCSMYERSVWYVRALTKEFSSSFHKKIQCVTLT